jgi:hypothetical protein
VPTEAMFATCGYEIKDNSAQLELELGLSLEMIIKGSSVHTEKTTYCKQRRHEFYKGTVE